MTPGPPMEGEAKARFEVAMATLAVKRLNAALGEYLEAVRVEMARLEELKARQERIPWLTVLW